MLKSLFGTILSKLTSNRPSELMYPDKYDQFFKLCNIHNIDVDLLDKLVIEINNSMEGFATVSQIPNLFEFLMDIKRTGDLHSYVRFSSHEDMRATQYLMQCTVVKLVLPNGKGGCAFTPPDNRGGEYLIAHGSDIDSEYFTVTLLEESALRGYVDPFCITITLRYNSADLANILFPISQSAFESPGYIYKLEGHNALLTLLLFELPPTERVKLPGGTLNIVAKLTNGNFQLVNLSDGGEVCGISNCSIGLKRIR